MRLRRSTERYKQTVSHGCWVTVTADGRECFHFRPSARPACRPPTFHRRVHSPTSINRPLQSRFSQLSACILGASNRTTTEVATRLCSPSEASASWGFRVPSSRHQLVVSTCHAKHPASRYVPSSAFHPPSTVFSTTCLVGLFRPTATFRVFPSGIWPHRRAVPGYPRTDALLPFPPPHLPFPKRWLQCSGPGFRALLPTMSATHKG
jgi:hypothetical protein